MENNEIVTTISRLNGLIKQKRNDEVKSILLKELPSNSINKGESSLLHTAVVFNNIDIIALLFSFGFDINAKNTLGQTPLLLAAHNNSCRVIQLLLALGAEVFVDDFRGDNAFQILLNKDKNTPSFIIGSLLERSIKKKISPDKIADELMKVDYPLGCIVDLNDTDLLREMLERKKRIDKATSLALLKRAMRSKNINNVQVLLHYGPDVDNRQMKFIAEVTKNILNSRTKPFFEEMFNWDIVDRTVAYKINDNITYGKEKHVQYLLDIGYDKYCKEKFDYDVLVGLFGNKNISIRYIDEVLRNKEFDVANSRDEYGYSALHVATMKENECAVIYLLDNGANPNVMNSKGETPLFFINDNEDIGELLIAAGADIQVMTEHGETLVDDDFVFANLMIMRARGIPLNDDLHQWIFGIDIHDRIYGQIMLERCESNSQDLEWMKTRWISDTITLFYVLTEKFERLSRYVKDEKTCEEILKAMKERSLKPTYINMLKKNLKRACEMNELKVMATEFLCDRMQIASDDHLVIRMIVGFLKYQDLLVFHELEDDDDDSDDNSTNDEDDDDDDFDDNSQTEEDDDSDDNYDDDDSRGRGLRRFYRLV